MKPTIAHVSSATLQSLTLPELIDYHLEHNPDCTFTVFPGETYDDEPSRISFLEFGRAAQRFARAVCPTAPVEPGQGEIIGLIAICDTLTYMTAIAGFVRAGITVFPMSQRNSAAAICSMLRKVSCHRLAATTASLGPLLEDVKSELAESDYALEIEELPVLPDIYPHFTHETPEDPFESIALPLRDAFVDGVVVYLHSSGSTGFPKPIPFRHDVFSNYTFGPYCDEYRSVREDLLMAQPGLPSFHILGLLQLQHPLYTGRPMGIFRPTWPRPPTVTSPQTILQTLKAVRASAALVVPSILEVWVHDPDAVAFLRTLDILCFSGGPLSASVGDILVAQGIHIACVYGGTEFGVVTRAHTSVQDRTDWSYFEIYNSVNARWAPQGDGTFELQILPCETHRPSVVNMESEGGYATKDLLVPHPTKKGLWKIIGRVDDVIILATGEKIVPGPTEGTLLAHPAVQGVVMFGRERNQAGILVELVEHRAFNPADERTLVAFRNEIWPAVEQANRIAPAFGRVFKEMILVTKPGKPLPRVGKGSISRKGALSLYDEEIRTLYDIVDHPEKGSSVPPSETWDNSDILKWLVTLAYSIRDGNEILQDVDLFAQGFDSLSATFLRNNIITALRASAKMSVAQKVGNGFVYANPILSGMANVIHALVASGDQTEEADPTVPIKKMIDLYSKDMPALSTEGEAKPDGEIVLLTGSTGSLGSQLLIALLVDERVRKVYVLNRPSAQKTSVARHEETFRDRGLDPSVLSSPRLVFLEGEISQTTLGVSRTQYEELLTSVTIIIHNAWRLDFNLSLSSFEPNIHGIRNLLDLALNSPHATHIRVLFTSSISVSQSWPRSGEPFPEEPQDDARWCIGTGYGEAKYVGEQLLVKAVKRGLQTTSFRIGQICGGNANGAWATTDWLPIMIKSSIALGCLPDAQGVTSLIPFDTVSKAILDVALGTETPERVLNLVHPRPTPWHSIIEAASDLLFQTEVTSTQLPLVSVDEWFSKLSEVSVGADDQIIQCIPAIKILDFFRGMRDADLAVRASGQTNAEAAGLTILSTEKSQRASQAMHEVQPLNSEDVGRWIRYWKRNGMFTQ